MNAERVGRWPSHRERGRPRTRRSTVDAIVGPGASAHGRVVDHRRQRVCAGLDGRCKHHGGARAPQRSVLFKVDPPAPGSPWAHRPRRVYAHTGLLEGCGVSLAHLVALTAVVASMADYAEVNRAYATFFGLNPPAR